MKEKTRLTASLIASSFIFLGFGLAIIIFFFEQLPKPFVWMAEGLLLLAFCIGLWKHSKLYKEVKSGLPLEDERTKIIAYRAGFIAYITGLVAIIIRG